MNKKKDYVIKKLTDRHIEIIRLLAEGNSYLEIAKTLHVSIRTVEGHCLRIQKYFGASNSAHLVSLAYQNKILNVIDKPIQNEQFK